MKTKIGILLYFVVSAVILTGTGCGNHPDPYIPVTSIVVPVVNNVHNDFSVQFSGRVVGRVIDQSLTFTNSKIKLAIISGNTSYAAIFGIQIYKNDNSMPFKKTFTLGGNLTLEEIVSLDFVPARIIIDIPDYTATGFILQVQAVQ